VWPQGTVQQRIETFVAQWPDVYLLQSFFVTFLNPGSETARSPAKAFLETLGRFQADKVTPWLALRNTIGVAVPLAAGVALGAVSGGLAVATGALNVSFSDSHDPYVQRGGRMLVASVLVGLAVFVGSMWGGNNLAAVLIAGLWAFAAGMLVALNTTAADIGTISLVTLIVYSAVPQSPERAVYGGLLAFSGGLLQTLLAVLMWPLRRYAPERRALGELFIELAKAASKPVDALQSPPASAESTRAQTALATLSNARTPAGERYLLLLSQAERIRLSLLILIRLRVRMKRETPGSPQAVLVDSYLAVSSQLLHSIGTSLLAGQPIGTAADSLEKLEALAEELCCPQPGQSELAAAVATDARKQMDALTGQIRAAVDLETNLTPAGQKSFERGESEKPWRLRLAGRLATLRANLSLESTACRHAVRLAVCVAFGDALARGLGLPRAYWVPMTIAILLKPDFTATFSRGALRLIGTFTGLLLATGIFHFLQQNKYAEVALAAVFMFILRCFGGANYGILTTAVTALVVVLIALTGVPPKEVMIARAVNTLAGGTVALLAYWLWPTWERTQIRETMAQMLEAFREYFAVIRDAYMNPDRDFAAELDRTRVAGRLARSNLEASVDRLISEPGTPKESVGLLNAMLASWHRFTHGLMALEAGLSSSRAVPARKSFGQFGDDVELTLKSLAAALRGSPESLDQLPNLREDHRELVHTGHPQVERYALVNVETDRITNSLNTFGEELVKWLGSQQS
jgi:uncharacterized membrane protein YccC